LLSEGGSGPSSGSGSVVVGEGAAGGRPEHETEGQDDGEDQREQRGQQREQGRGDVGDEADEVADVDVASERGRHARDEELGMREVAPVERDRAGGQGAAVEQHRGPGVGAGGVLGDEAGG